MHDATRAELVARLQKLSADERADLMAQASEQAKADAGMERAAAALAQHVSHHQPKGSNHD